MGQRLGPDYLRFTASSVRPSWVFHSIQPFADRPSTAIAAMRGQGLRF